MTYLHRAVLSHQMQDRLRRNGSAYIQLILLLEVSHRTPEDVDVFNVLHAVLRGRELRYLRLPGQLPPAVQDIPAPDNVHVI